MDYTLTPICTYTPHKLVCESRDNYCEICNIVSTYYICENCEYSLCDKCYIDILNKSKESDSSEKVNNIKSGIIYKFYYILFRLFKMINYILYYICNKNIQPKSKS